MRFIGISIKFGIAFHAPRGIEKFKRFRLIIAFRYEYNESR